MSKTNLKYCIYCILLIALFSSCKTTQQQAALYNPQEVAHLSSKLGIELSNTDKDDDKYMPLYAEASLWLGVKYRYGGTTKRGVDCSGLSSEVYKKVYGKKLPRSTDELAKKGVRNISSEKLQPGDLIFFATSKNKNKINHVGIYLKNGRFIHASTTRGVVVNNINENYYKKTWVKNGRVK